MTFRTKAKVAVPVNRTLFFHSRREGYSIIDIMQSVYHIEPQFSDKDFAVLSFEKSVGRKLDSASSK